MHLAEILNVIMKHQCNHNHHRFLRFCLQNRFTAKCFHRWNASGHTDPYAVTPDQSYHHGDNQSSQSQLTAEIRSFKPSRKECVDET